MRCAVGKDGVAEPANRVGRQLVRELLLLALLLAALLLLLLTLVTIAL